MIRAIVDGAIYNSAMDTLDKKKKQQNSYWFEAGVTELEPAIEQLLSATRTSFPRRHSLHSEKPETMLSGLLHAAPTTTD